MAYIDQQIKERQKPWKCGCGELNPAPRKDCGNCGSSVDFPFDPIFQKEVYDKCGSNWQQMFKGTKE